MTLALRYSAPEKPQATFSLLADRLTVGSLSTNQVVLAAPGVEPIHCLIETTADGRFRVVDLGALAGVKVNGHRIEIEAVVTAGDVLEIGSARVELTTVTPEPARALRAIDTEPLATKDPRRLFRPETKPGRHLEVIAYWGDTILNVEHFHPSIKGMQAVTIGDPTKAHFPSGGRDFFKSSVLAHFADESADGAVLRLDGDMSARVRVGGKISAHAGKHRLELGQRDYAQVQYGAINYFLHFAEPPRVELPVSRAPDKVLNALLGVGFVAYLAMVLVALTITPKPLAPDVDPCAQTLCYTSTPREETTITLDPPKREKVPVKVTELTPPVKPVKVTEPARKKRVTLPETPVKKTTPTIAMLPRATVTPNAATTPNAGGAPRTGGPGVQMRPTQAAAPLEGTQKTNNPGVEGGTRAAPGAVDLRKLGNGFGTTSSLADGIKVGSSTPGGRGAKSGTAVKDYGLGEPGDGTRLNVPGSNGAGWGPGDGNLLDGLPHGRGNGPGTGPGPGSGPGKSPGSFGHNEQVAVLMPSTGVQYSSPDYSQAVKFVIGQHLNEIRHCYEQFLQRSPGVEGRVRAKFVIAPNGRVTTSAIDSSTIADAKFQGCVTGKIARWKFQPMRGPEPLTVTYPFDFTAL